MHRPPPAGLVLALTTLLGLLVVAFAWPTSQLEPRHVPIAVAGPAEAVDGLESSLAQRVGTDAFDVTALATRDEAIAAVEEREVYGAFVLSPDGVEVLTAPAASPAVAEALTGIAAGIGAAAPGGSAATVTEVVPLPAGDPHGAVFASGSLPIVLGGIATGVVAALLLRRSGTVVAVVSSVAVAAAGVSVLVLQAWLDVLGGDWWANSGVLALGLTAIALAVAGLGRTLGKPGIALGVLTVLLLGNPLSGVTSAPEMLPGGWGDLGQLLPPGSVTQALRSTAHFDGAALGAPLLVLATWVVAGLVLLALPRRRTTLVDEVPAAREPVVVHA